MSQAPVVAGESSRHVAFRANESLADELDAFVHRTGASKAEVIREALRQYLEQEVKAS